MKSYIYKAGDRVAYNHSYLRAVQGDKDVADMRGTVTGNKVIKAGLSLTSVLWDGEISERRSMSTNLCRVTDKILDHTE